MLQKAVDSIDVDMEVRVLENTTGWLKAVNEAGRTIDGAVLLAGDDMLFKPGAIQKALDVFEAYSQDTDRVVGFNQSNLKGACEAGFTLMGEGFRDRFPNRQVFCPDYGHYYADTELLRFARMVGKFTFCEAAEVLHWHFSVLGYRDDTSKLVGTLLEDDRARFELRQKRGLLWGSNFKLLHEGGSHGG